MLPELTDRLLRGWEGFFPETEEPRTLRYLGIPGSVEGGTTTFLAFGETNRQPVFVVKVHRDPDAGEAAQNERDVLMSLERRGPVGISVPRVILCERLDRTWLLVQSILDGRPMEAAMTPQGVPEAAGAAANLTLAGEWLCALHGATVDTSPQARGAVKGRLLDAIAEFRSVFEPARREQACIDRVTDGLDAVLGGGVCVQHGDFCRQNILVSHLHGTSRIGVVDWTFSRRSAAPLHDMVSFVLTYFLQIRKYHGMSGFTHAFEYTFLEDNAYSALVRGALADYCRRIGIAEAAVQTALAMVLIEKAVFEYQQLQKCAQRGGLPRITVYLASLRDASYRDAMREQLWVHFFRVLANHRHEHSVGH
jgi:aminoglycoside phosphotransferase (APT) family kinase protein